MTSAMQFAPQAPKTVHVAARANGPPVAGASCWVITDGKSGMDVQARGVADALNIAYEMKTVAPRGLAAALAPWGPVGRQERFGAAGSAFAPPWPRLAIATGRASIPYVRALKRLSGTATTTVVLQNPRTGARTADLIWVPAHDTLRAANVITSLTAPHSFTQARLAALRAAIPDPISALPRPRVAVILGGDNGVYRFTGADLARLAAALAQMSKLGASFLITPSRRTDAALLAAVTGAAAASQCIVWDQRGPNPYPDFLASADQLVVTADSVNMCGEACATGRPVHVFFPSGGSAKFRRFHAGLAATGATRPLTNAIADLDGWSYTPIDSAAMIARTIRDRFGHLAPACHTLRTAP